MVTISYCYTDNRTHVFFGTENLDLTKGGRIRFAQGIGGVSPYQQWLDEGNEGSFAEFIGLWHSHVNKSTLDKISDSLFCVLEKFGLDKNGKLVYDGQKVNLGDTSTVKPDPANSKMYYGYITAAAAGSITSVKQITADILAAAKAAGTMTEVATAAAIGKVTLDNVPAYSWIVALLPPGLKAVKDDGVGGKVEFSLNNGTNDSGANGAMTIIGSDKALVYGELQLITAKTTIYIEED